MLSRLRGSGLTARLLLLALLFSVELVAITVVLDNDFLRSSGGWVWTRIWGSAILRAVVGFAALFVTFAYLRNKPVLLGISKEVEEAPPRPWLFVGHLFALSGFAALSRLLYGGGALSPFAGMVMAVWLSAGLSAIGLASLAMLPLRLWIAMLRGTGALWAYTLIACLAAVVAGNAVQSLWLPATALTFQLVGMFLRPFLTGIIANPAEFTIGTSRFWVQIAPQCSGLEGVGLILAFTTIWLLLFRRESRFPHALILVPAGVVAIFLTNAVRITALVLIGNAGAREIAAGGFHSQAGWIGFNAVAFGLCIAARRIRWISSTAVEPASTRAEVDNPTAAYLMPFLAILAAGMLSVAAKGTFEWFYPLRLVAAGAALWMFRARYKGLDWTFGLTSILAGGITFLFWVGLDLLQPARVNDGMPQALAASSGMVRTAWISIRCLAAVVTVPIAEELAFRGFLIRRLMSADFESLSPHSFHYSGLLISSVAFGLLHGDRWFAGSVAGLLYGLVYVHRGRIGDAVAAHATTNALLAAYVLAFGKWGYW